MIFLGKGDALLFLNKFEQWLLPSPKPSVIQIVMERFLLSSTYTFQMTSGFLTLIIRAVLIGLLSTCLPIGFSGRREINTGLLRLHPGRVNLLISQGTSQLQCRLGRYTLKVTGPPCTREPLLQYPP